MNRRPVKRKAIKADMRIKVNQNFQQPLEDKKINGKSWLVKMSVGDYLIMADVEGNEYQRNLQNLSFYKKLIDDLLDDTTMPPISVVYPEKDIDFEVGLKVANKFIILDGLQRTNCLKECVDIIETGKSKGYFTTKDEFLKKLIYVEIWEKLELKDILYKMVVLNTGQKKMDYGHQVEILSDSIKDRLKDAGIPFITVKEKAKGKVIVKAYELSLITQGLVSFINKSPIPGKKNAAEFLFERFNISIEGNDEENVLVPITDDETYNYMTWVLKDFDQLLSKTYKGENPLRKYDVFLVSLFASLGYCHSKDPENLKKKLNILVKSFNDTADPLKLGVFEECYAKFKTGIGDKRRRFIFEALRAYFLSIESVDRVEWEYYYDRVL